MSPLVDGPLLEVDNLRVSFPTPTGVRHAVDGVSFTLNAGETLGIIGESGCGKTMTGQAILRTVPPPGRVVARAVRLVTETGTVDLTALGPRGLRVIHRHAQMVFQDQAGSLNPRHTVRQIVTEPLVAHGLAASAELDASARELAELVGLDAATSITAGTSSVGASTSVSGSLVRLPLVRGCSLPTSRWRPSMSRCKGRCSTT